MDSDLSNVIIKCLGKALKTTIKFVCPCIVKFNDSSLNEITNNIMNRNASDMKTPCKVYICLGTTSVYFLSQDMRKIYEKMSYDVFTKTQVIRRNNQDDLCIYVDGSKGKIKNKKIASIVVIMKNVKVFLKNLMCYYTIYNEFNNDQIKTLESMEYVPDDKEEQQKKENKSSKFREFIIKNYSFYWKGIVEKNPDGPGFHIKYFVDKNKERGDVDYFTEECDILIDVSDPAPICQFDQNPNLKELSYYAYSSVWAYLKNTLKSGKFWLWKNEMYNKKINWNEDMSFWEGWKIEVRSCEPTYQNIVFIFLRRKYIPPFFDTYQDFLVILSEKSSWDNFEINPEAYSVISLAANSLSTPLTSNEKDNELFLMAKIDALLVDEETWYFYQNVYDIIGEDVFTFGYELLSNLWSYFEKTNVKESVETLRAIIEVKKSKLRWQCKKWEITKNFETMKRVRGFIKATVDDIVGVKSNDNNIGEDEKDIDMDITPGPVEQPTTKGNWNKHNKGKSNNYWNDVTPQKSSWTKKYERIQKIWTKKWMRFIGYSLNGGFADFKMNYDMFLKEVLDACQNTNNDIAELCYNTIYLRDLQSPNKNWFQSKSIVPSWSTDSLMSFNSEPMNYCISSNFLPKYLETSGSKFIATWLSSKVSNKLLKAVYDNWKYRDNPNNVSEKSNIISLISPLREIFEDNRQNPITLLLAGKSLCWLVKNESDKVHRIKLSDEGNLLRTIGDYWDEYESDQQLILCCFDLFGYITTEIRDKWKSALYNSRGTGWMNKFIKFLDRPEIPGVYYSQRIMIKVISILLTWTTNIEADVKQMFNTQHYQIVYNKITNLLNEKGRKKVIDPSEEESSILDFKNYYLLMVLTFKNEIATNYLFNVCEFQSVIKENSVKYLNEVKALVGLKEKASDSEKKCIGKKVYKFLELVYYWMVNNDLIKNDIFEGCPEFNELKVYFGSRIDKIWNENEYKNDVISMISKLYLKFKDELTSY